MGKVLHFETENGKIIELEIAAPGADHKDTAGQQPVGRSFASGAKAFDSVFDDLRAYAQALAETIDKISLKPSQVEVSLGMKLKGETGSIMAVFVKGSADADLAIKLTWKTEAKAI